MDGKKSSSSPPSQALGAYPGPARPSAAATVTPRDRRSWSGPPILVPVALLLVATALIRVFDLDLRIARRCFDPQAGWTQAHHELVQLLYHYGTWPVILVAGIAGAVWLGSRFHDRLKTSRGLAMFLALSLGLGPGLMVNTLFKGYFGRPRPAQLVEFGGHLDFAPVGEPRFGSGGKSFPSGHAAMGFFWLSFTVYYWERRRQRALGFALLALLHGGTLGWGRMMQGGHWLSDVLWAAGFVYFAALILYRALRLSPAYSAPARDHRDPNT